MSKSNVNNNKKKLYEIERIINSEDKPLAEIVNKCQIIFFNKVDFHRIEMKYRLDPLDVAELMYNSIIFMCPLEKFDVLNNITNYQVELLLSAIKYVLNCEHLYIIDDRKSNGYWKLIPKISRRYSNIFDKKNSTHFVI